MPKLNNYLPFISMLGIGHDVVAECIKTQVVLQFMVLTHQINKSRYNKESNRLSLQGPHGIIPTSKPSTYPLTPHHALPHTHPRRTRILMLLLLASSFRHGEEKRQRSCRMGHHILDHITSLGHNTSMVIRRQPQQDRFRNRISCIKASQSGSYTK